MTTTTTIDRSVAQASALTAEQVAALAAPLSRANVKQRDQGRGKVSYIEGWVAIAEANRIFGFDGWQRETVALQFISQAHESALKEAETDAMKRALMTFGNPFGLVLYDKQQRQVTTTSTERPSNGNTSSTAAGNDTLRRSPAGNGHLPSAHHPAGLPSAAAASDGVDTAQEDPALLPLDVATIWRIHATIRSLPQPQLEGFTKAFRKRFQVPEAASSIADRINQKQHHDWIEAYLVQRQTVA
jgi:hypothetical protein